MLGGKRGFSARIASRLLRLFPAGVLLVFRSHDVVAGCRPEVVPDYSVAPPAWRYETSIVASAPKPVFSVQVRELVEFALRRGDLGGGRDFVGRHRALAGTRGHQRIQRSRPAGYQKEVPLSFDVETPGLVLRVQGRIDGLLVTPRSECSCEPGNPGEPAGTSACADGSPCAGAEEVLLEEIKTVRGGWDGVADPLHWAQARIYGFMWARAHDLPRILIQLVYLNLDTGGVTAFRECFSLVDLSAFFQETMVIYLEWIEARRLWCGQRDQSTRALQFPVPRYRPGQRQLAVAAYRTLARGGRLFLEAPTGIGKTVSVLFPAIKALGEGKIGRIFYLTARTVGRAVAEKALADLRAAGLRVRFLTLTAKEKVCAQEGHPCDAVACPLACGYYDRRMPAMCDALACEEITRPVLEAVAREHRVCPFELSLDLSSWVDVVICDYNYVFDPRAYLRRHFDDGPGDCAFLVDEAHNLADRARDMFSADLDAREIEEVRRAIKGAVPRCARALTRLASAMRKLSGQATVTAGPPEIGASCAELDLFAPGSGAGDLRAVFPANHNPPCPGPPAAFPRQTGDEADGAPVPVPPGELVQPIENALLEAETWLARNQPASFRECLLELYFRLYAFQRVAQLYDNRFVTITGGVCLPVGKTLIQRGAATASPTRMPAPRVASPLRVRLFCLDPSFLLRQALERGKAAIFFSATLTPMDFHRSLLGGDPGDALLQLPSPFPPEHLAVLVQDRIRTHLKARAETLPEVVQAIRALVLGRPGNYLVYLPSYQYLATVHEQFQAIESAIPTLVQRSGMSESEREGFLAAFGVDRGETLLGFAVMGGVFGEGIDLVGERLIGAVIVGVGLPQLCVERDLIRDYFEGQASTGFDYAYTFPGMNRVLQATGRVIRSETDRGVVLLIDARFAEPRYRRLFPPWWLPARVRSPGDISQAVRRFWHPSPMASCRTVC